MTVDQIANPPSYGSISRNMRIVGVAVFPSFSRGSFTATDLGGGAAVLAGGCPVGSCFVKTDQRPADIRNYTSVRDTPLLLGAVLALLAVTGHRGDLWSGH